VTETHGGRLAVRAVPSTTGPLQVREHFDGDADHCSLLCQFLGQERSSRTRRHRAELINSAPDDCRVKCARHDTCHRRSLSDIPTVLGLAVTP
jgi:hypothetical protein